MSEVLKLDDRRDRIMEILNRTGKVRVAELSQTFGTSEVTIRNDLSELEKNGYLERIPGGAVQTMRNYYNMDLQQRKNENMQEKQSIASAVVLLVNDGDTIFINAGTTTYFTALELKTFKNLKIITNSIAVAMELTNIPYYHVQLLGGSINPQYSFTYGDLALKELSKFKADKVILSVDGVCPQSGLTTYHAEEAELSKAMIERSRTTIVVADYTKIGHESFLRIADVSAASYLVTNKRADSSMLDDIKDLGISIITD